LFESEKRTVPVRRAAGSRLESNVALRRGVLRHELLTPRRTECRDLPHSTGQLSSNRIEPRNVDSRPVVAKAKCEFPCVAACDTSRAPGDVKRGSFYVTVDLNLVLVRAENGIREPLSALTIYL
jgi:hypothetical protein